VTSFILPAGDHNSIFIHDRNDNYCLPVKAKYFKSLFHMMGHTLLHLWFIVPSFHTRTLTFGHVKTLIVSLHFAHTMIQTPLLVIHFPHIPLSQHRTCTKYSNDGVFFQFYYYLRQTNTYFGSRPPGLPLPVEQNSAQNLKTTCQRVRHSKEQTTMIGLIILWNEEI